MYDLSGRGAVITGAASGIGLALAERAASEGMRVVMADVEQTSLEQAVAEVRSDTGAEVLAVATDVSSLASVEALAQRATDAFGPVGLLCNNAGVAAGGFLSEMSMAAWEWVLGVNLWGVIHGATGRLGWAPRPMSARAAPLSRRCSSNGCWRAWLRLKWPPACSKPPRNAASGC